MQRVSPPLFEPLGYIMVRAPLFPVEAYRRLDLPTPTNDEALSISQQPRSRLALAVGSLALSDEIERPPSSPRTTTKRDQKLLRYLIRMATRPTPYGLFAGVALGQWGGATDLTIAEPLGHIQARLDMGWLMPLIYQVEARPSVRSHLRWVVNSAIYFRNGRVFLHERASAQPSSEPQGASRVSLRATAAVKRTLDLARHPIAYSYLVEALCSSIAGATREKVDGLLTELWQQTVLLSDLRPPLTGDLHPAEYLQHRLATIPETVFIAEYLATILAELRAWEEEPAELTLSRYRALLGQIKGFTKGWDTFFGAEGSTRTSAYSSRPQATAEAEEPELLEAGDSKPLLQIDMGLGLASRTLNAQVGADAARMAEVMLCLTPLPYGPAALTPYRNSFRERYGEDRAVPLVELLDQEFGLGALETGDGMTILRQQEPQNAKRDQTLIYLALTAQQKRQLVVELDEGLLKRLETWMPNFTTAPDSVDLNILLAAPSAEAVDAGRYQLVLGPSIGGQEGGSTFGRFAPLFGEEGSKALRYTAACVAQQASGTLLAELVYLPRRHRLGNIAIRPAIHSHELSYATSAGVGHEQMIPLHELIVGLRGDRFYLHWPQKQVDILPRRGHLLTTLGAPPLIRLIAAISREGRPFLASFDWGAAAIFPFLPRIQMDRLVLSLAQWRLTTDTRARDLPTTSPGMFQEALSVWRECWQVPRYVYLSVADQRLLLDLEHSQQREVLRSELHKLQEDSSLILQEVFPTLDQAWVQGPGGHYMTEFVVPLLRSAKRGTNAHLAQTNESRGLDQSERAMVPSLVKPTDQHLKGLGSEWLYVKLYAGRQVQEELIAGPLRAFARTALKEALAEDWFFIRYADPDPHLRLRFRGDPSVLTGKLLPRLCEWCSDLMTKGPCLKYSFDTYDREIERYGGLEGLEVAEALFGADSRAVADLLALALSVSPAPDRKLLAALTADELLKSLGADPPARLAWYRQRVKERHQAGQTYRQHSKHLRLLLSDPAQALEGRAEGVAMLSILVTRRQTLAPLAKRLAELEAMDTLCQPRAHLYASYFHMHCVRLLGLDRVAEDEVAELLLRTHESLACTPANASLS